MKLKNKLQIFKVIIIMVFIFSQNNLFADTNKIEKSKNTTKSTFYHKSDWIKKVYINVAMLFENKSTTRSYCTVYDRYPYLFPRQGYPGNSSCY